MDSNEKKQHWENIYQTKQAHQLSWTQDSPFPSLGLCRRFDVPETGKIIDVGGGNSILVDNLLEFDYEDITVLDISEAGLNRAKKRLGERAEKIKWIVADILQFKPTEKYDFWHDRATFHFLTEEADIETYINTMQSSIKPGGLLVIGTFSEQGPDKCSGLTIKQYSEATLTERLQKWFEKLDCFTVDHRTPNDSKQNFIFGSFRRL